ncbi:hypothetical protein LCGC14_1212990 [marine sediment metagenome]|uniref:Uncharacterized protein n=1 Tax=marine sediment metagenome TaxID=412755 RepID=A0A0F9NVT5_9ZZZZ|nr:hypothetical protein [Candidatus Scalindua sediminis]HDY66634.1 hypothetical protein [Candidatus Scalindua sp.]
MTIRRKLLFWILPPIIVIGTITVGTVYYFISKNVKQNIFDQLEIAVEELLKHVSFFLEGKRGRTTDFVPWGIINYV